MRHRPYRSRQADFAEIDAFRRQGKAGKRRHQRRRDGQVGGRFGDALMRVTDVFLAVPSLILAIALAQLLHAGIGGAILALSLTYWPHFCRQVYAETSSMKTSVFVEALVSIGAKSQRIIFMHILPNIASGIIVRTTIGLGYIIMTSAVLGFLGIGVPPPTAEE